MPGKTMEAIKGKRKHNSCTFCRKSSTEGCGNISNCQKKREFGIHLKKAKSGVNEVDLLHTYIKSCSNVGTDYFAPWPAGSRSVLQQGVPTEARHIVVHGFYSFRTKSGPIIVVSSIQFLVEGGNEVDAYKCLPITLDELVKILYKDFSAQMRHVFVHESLYGVMQPK
jgi:hypothetical protein